MSESLSFSQVYHYDTLKTWYYGRCISPFDAFPHWIQLEILGISTNSLVMFASEPSFTRNVLGRVGWLDRVRLGLVDYESKLFLNSYE